MIALMLMLVLQDPAAAPQPEKTADQQMAEAFDWGPAPAPDATPPPPPSGTTPEAADQACRGQIHRRPGETRAACVARLVETDALSVPLPIGNTPPTQTRQCRRVTTQSEDGTSSSFRVICSSGDSERAREMLDSLLQGD